MLDYKPRADESRPAATILGFWVKAAREPGDVDDHGQVQAHVSAAGLTATLLRCLFSGDLACARPPHAAVPQLTPTRPRPRSSTRPRMAGSAAPRATQYALLGIACGDVWAGLLASRKDRPASVLCATQADRRSTVGRTVVVAELTGASAGEPLQSISDLTPVHWWGQVTPRQSECSCYLLAW